jgi:hypothetical protein
VLAGGPSFPGPIFLSLEDCGCPVLAFCKGAYSGRRKWVSVDLGYAIAKRNLAPTYIDAHRSGVVG